MFDKMNREETCVIETEVAAKYFLTVSYYLKVTLAPDRRVLVRQETVN